MDERKSMIAEILKKLKSSRFPDQLIIQFITLSWLGDRDIRQKTWKSLRRPGEIYEADFDNEKTFAVPPLCDMSEKMRGKRATRKGSPQFNLGSLMHGEFVHILFILCDYIGFRMAESDAMWKWGTGANTEKLQLFQRIKVNWILVEKVGCSMGLKHFSTSETYGNIECPRARTTYWLRWLW